MTTLIMRQYKGDVELGWDSRMTRANEMSMVVAPKMFVNGGMIFGVSGALRAADVLETTEFPEYEGLQNPRHWLIKEMVPTLRTALASDPVLLAENGTADGWGLLAVVGGQAFQFDSLFNPAQSKDGVYTMGSGGDYARGALFAGASVREALGVAALIDPYTGGDLVVRFANEYLKSVAKESGKL